MEPVRGDFTPEEYNRMHELLTGNVSEYVRSSRYSTNTRLFGFLALLNGYIPGSYLLMSECRRILGPPDPIHGGPPFESRMEPFTQFIRRSTDDERICIHPEFAETALEVMVKSGATRSTTVKNLMTSLCGVEPQPDTIEFVKDLLTKREMGERRKEKFSRLIQDICKENPYNAISVLKTASDVMRGHFIFPQTLSRFYYIERNIPQFNFERAEEWARRAIGRAPNNSYVADTLGQVFKNRLLSSARYPEDTLRMANEAWQAFREVEEKADREVGPDMVDDADASSPFNNRGRFGLIQVAKIAHEKLQRVNDPQQRYGRRLQEYRTEVEDKFDFFERYLTYSKPDKTSLEPHFFWKDVADCYSRYTGASAADSTSFPGLLECLNHGLFTSRGRYSQLVEFQKTLPELETICNELRTTYEENVDDDDDAAERYVLSNVILSNRAPNSPSLTPLAELKGILSRFLGRDAEHRRPEFYLLVLLLFWPQEHPEVVQEEDEEEGEEAEQPDTADDSSGDETWEDQDTPEDQETEGEAAQPPQEVEFEADLQQCVTSMGEAFDNHYSKYLQGRYLVPLFFLGKGAGLSRWIHKSKLDTIVETEVDAQLAPEGNVTEKWELINGLWSTGKVWQIPAVQQILLPVMIEPPHLATIPQEQQEKKVFIFAGGRRILATTEFGSDAQAPTPLYLGLTIQGPVVFKQHVGTSSEFGG